MPNFWEKLKKPFFTLAPMYDVTDEAFRQMFVKYGKPDVLYTEFVSADGLCNEQGRKKVSRELYFQKNEHPIVAQIFGANPETIYEAAKLIKEMGFDGLEINMGCPERTILKQGAGSALIKTPDLAVEIIEAAKRGAGDLPVSVKTRLGYYKPREMTEWLKKVLSAKPVVLTVHLRTMKDMSKVPARWDLVDEVVALAREVGVLIVANGDVESLAEAKAKAEKHDLDGVMIGRGVFGNPWWFANLARARREGQIEHPVPNPGSSAGTNSPDLVSRSADPSDLLGLGYTPTVRERLAVVIEQTKIFEELYCPGETNTKLFGGHTKNFSVMKKHFRAYVKGFSGAPALREKLMNSADNAKEVEKIVNDFLKIDK